MGIAAELIRVARQEAGITLAELAARVGTSAPTLSRYENGLVDPGAGTLDRILRGCGQALRAAPAGMPVTLEELTERFRGQGRPSADDVTRTRDGRELRTADDLEAFAAELRSEGLLVR